MAVAESNAASPPGPPGHWLRGHLPEVQRDPAGFFLRCALEYGGVVRLRFGRRPALLVTDPETVRQVLVERAAQYVKTSRYNRIRIVLGEGLVLSEGESWKRQHDASRRSFQTPAIERDATWMIPVADRHLDGWEARSRTGVAIDLEPDLVRLTQELMGRWCFGERYASFADELASCLDVLRNIYTITRTGLLAKVALLSPFRRRAFTRALGTLDRIVFGAIRDLGHAQDSGLLAGLRKAQPSADERSLRDQIVSVFIPAYETSSTSLTWACLLLARHPEWRRRLRQEASAPRAGIEGLVLAERFLQESLRLYPPAGWFTRCPVQDERVGSFTAPAGATVILCPYATHRLPRYWKDPEGFDPDRFAPEASAGRPSLAYYPFGAGPRACIGGRLGMMQMKIILSRIVARFRLELTPGQSIEPRPGGTIRIRNGLHVTVHAADREPTAGVLTP